MSSACSRVLAAKRPRRCAERGASAETALPKLRVVPEAVWLAALGVFSALYLAFFFVQGRYLFGAFTRTLPESFTVAEYARQGFFELCRVMAINFTLFWLVTRTARRESKPVRWMTAALLIESMLFAVDRRAPSWRSISTASASRPSACRARGSCACSSFGSACALYTHLTGRKSPCASG